MYSEERKQNQTPYATLINSFKI